jgi:phage gpG-like protein
LAQNLERFAVSTFRIDVSALATLAQRLQSCDIKGALQQGMETGCAKLASYIVQSKLSGEVLNIRTGNLAQSVETPSPGPSSDTSVTYLVGGKWYRKVQEFGASITVNHAVNLQNIGWRYLKTVTLPARPWLNPSIEEQKDMIGQEVVDAIKEAIKL